MYTLKYTKSKKISILIFLTLFILYSVVYMTKNMFSAAMAAIVEEGIMTKSQTGAISAVFWLVYAPFQVIGGFAADKYSPFKLIVIGLVGSIAANTVIYFNQSYPVVISAWCFNAIIQFGLWPAIFKITSAQLAPSFRGTAIFWILFSTSVGLGLSMLIASFVSKWQYNFIVSVVSTAIVLVVWCIVYQFCRKSFDTEESFQEKEEISGHHHAEHMTTAELYLKTGLPIILIIGLFRCMVDNAMKMVTPVMLMESYESLPASIATRLGTILVIFSVLGTLVARFVQNKITRNEMKAVALLGFISIPPLLLACFVGQIHYWWILAGLSVAMVFVHGAGPFSNSFTASRYTMYGKGGAVSGMVNATASLGNVLASYFFARVAETAPWSTVTGMWLGAMVITAVASLAIYPVWKRFIEK